MLNHLNANSKAHPFVFLSRNSICSAILNIMCPTVGGFVQRALSQVAFFSRLLFVNSNTSQTECFCEGNYEHLLHHCLSYRHGLSSIALLSRNILLGTNMKKCDNHFRIVYPSKILFPDTTSLIASIFPSFQPHPGILIYSSYQIQCRSGCANLNWNQFKSNWIE